MKVQLIVMTALLASSVCHAGPLTLTIPAIRPAPVETFAFGTARRPDGAAITADSNSLRLDGRPWTPVMGEFHYARYPANEWREELLKMKAGGIDIVASYIFWIHHEEVEGQWDWSGSRDLRRFVELAHEVGLKVIMRVGPWCHGEVRNGGLPDWIVARGNDRTNDPAYLAKAHLLYEQIAVQLRGLLWKDGGPVIGLQIENEYGGPAEHLLTLKKIAREAGFDVPLYTRTGWPDLETPMPVGEMLPLYGAYPEGFWNGELTPMPGRYWAGFHFATLRIDPSIATDSLGQRDAKDTPDVARHPYLTCEIGGGMMSSYRRRILIYPSDIDAVMLGKLGSGSMSPGYYMYHGGTNPAGRLTTLMEARATPSTNWNDMPVKNYDFQAPLGQYGQIRPHYHRLRRLHMFLHDFGAALASMATTLPAVYPTGRDDLTTLRWAVRSDGHKGFVFVNNYERLRELPAKSDVQFALRLGDDTLLFPSAPITIPSGAHFLWPFNFDLGHGVTLAWATAQPLCSVDDGDTRTFFFAEEPGIPAQFLPVGAAGPRTLSPGHAPALILPGQNGKKVQIVLLNEADSLALWQDKGQDRERVFLTRAGLVVDGDKLRLTAEKPADLALSVFPAAGGKPDGIFRQVTLATPLPVISPVATECVQPAGRLRLVTPDKSAPQHAIAPTDADFADAAVWRIQLPADIDYSLNPILRLHYIGDVARVLIGDKLIVDDFYNGEPLEIGLRRHAAELKNGELTIAILPLQKGAPIYLSSPPARPEFAGKESVVRLERAEIVPRRTVELTGQP
jgi:hypothetical protein